MAKTKATQEGSAGSAAPAKRTSAKAPAQFADIAGILLAGKAAEDELRAKTGGSGLWVTLAQPGSGLISNGHPDFVKGMKEGQYYLKEKGLKLPTIKGTIIGMFPLYAQVKKTEKKDNGKEEMPQTLGFWHPDDAVQIPKLDGDNFTRVLRDGSILQPMHWLFIRIDGHEELKDVLIPFRSTGNSYFKDIEKLVRKSSKVCCELHVEIKSVGKYNDEWNKMYYYPTAEIIGRNFTLSDDGSIEPGDMESDDITATVEAYAECQKAYKEAGMLSRRSPAQLLALLPAGSAGAGQRVLPGATAGYAEDDGVEDVTPPAGKKGKAAKF